MSIRLLEQENALNRKMSLASSSSSSSSLSIHTRDAPLKKSLPREERTPPPAAPTKTEGGGRGGGGGGVSAPALSIDDVLFTECEGGETATSSAHSQSLPSSSTPATSTTSSSSSFSPSPSSLSASSTTAATTSTPSTSSLPSRPPLPPSAAVTAVPEGLQQPVFNRAAGSGKSFAFSPSAQIDLATVVLKSVSGIATEVRGDSGILTEKHISQLESVSLLLLLLLYPARHPSLLYSLQGVTEDPSMLQLDTHIQVSRESSLTLPLAHIHLLQASREWSESLHAPTQRERTQPPPLSRQRPWRSHIRSSHHRIAQNLREGEVLRQRNHRGVELRHGLVEGDKRSVTIHNDS